jgi:hypothetical protein
MGSRSGNSMIDFASPVQVDVCARSGQEVEVTVGAHDPTASAGA